MYSLLDKVSILKKDMKRFIGDMVRRSQDDAVKFQDMVPKDFLDGDIPDIMMDHDLFNKMIKNDKNLQELQEQIQEYKDNTYPDIKSKLDVLQKYITWLESVIKQLNNETTTEDPNEPNDKRQEKNRRKKQKKNNQRRKMKKICGFTHDLKYRYRYDT